MRQAAVMIPEREEEARWLMAEIGGLPLLKRVLLSSVKAGVEELFLVAPQPMDRWRRILEGDRRLAGRIRWMEGTPHEGRGVLAELKREAPQGLFLLPGNVLFDPRLLLELSKLDPDQTDGVIAGQRGKSTRIALVSSKLLDALLEQASRDLTIEEIMANLAAFAEKGMVKVYEVRDLFFYEIRNLHDLKEAEIELYRSLGTAVDGKLVDRFLNRKVSKALTRLLVRFPVTPNQITILSFLVGLLAAWCFFAGGYWRSLLGMALFQASVIIDLVDGEIARLKFLESKEGKWLDHNCDNLVHLAIIAGLAASGYRATGQGVVLLLGGMAVLGSLISFALFFSFVLVTKEMQARGLARLANRDGFSLALAACLLIDRPIWFLLIMAVGTNLFWPALLLSMVAAHDAIQEG